MTMIEVIADYIKEKHKCCMVELPSTLIIFKNVNVDDYLKLPAVGASSASSEEIIHIMSNIGRSFPSILIEDTKVSIHYWQNVILNLADPDFFTQFDRVLVCMMTTENLERYIASLAA